MSSFVSSRSSSFVGLVLATILVVSTVGCTDGPTAPTSAKKADSVVVSTGSVKVDVTPTVIKVGDTVIFTLTGSVWPTQLKACRDSKCKVATGSSKSVQFSPDEAGDWTWSVSNVVGGDSLFPVGSGSFLVN